MVEGNQVVILMSRGVCWIVFMLVLYVYMYILLKLNKR